jgi:hypothetical protein
MPRKGFLDMQIGNITFKPAPHAARDAGMGFTGQITVPLHKNTHRLIQANEKRKEIAAKLFEDLAESEDSSDSWDLCHKALNDYHAWLLKERYML